MAKAVAPTTTQPPKHPTRQSIRQHNTTRLKIQHGSTQPSPPQTNATQHNSTPPNPIQPNTIQHSTTQPNQGCAGVGYIDSFSVSDA
ncbi:hypothetical protein PAL_GLEAN10018082 [Pteropus alecto]|uniref:Uncharacterized protein n=1 Tax=Pteropus alecto TaxID=9402 RepID=L5KZ27_PTEAL|nr:hypothetical protein PAL_GLEAN10018082 [Pteropus alecto]